MKKSLVMILAVLLAAPLIARAQDHDGRRVEAPRAPAHGNDAGRLPRDADAVEDYGYPEAGFYDYGDGHPERGYGADFTYAYPDDGGRYRPFAYSYSVRDDAYYAGGGSLDVAGEAGSSANVTPSARAAAPSSRSRLASGDSRRIASSR